MQLGHAEEVGVNSSDGRQRLSEPAGSREPDRASGSQPTRANPRRPPAGARDLLPLDVLQKQWAEEKLMGVFQAAGYHRIITPTLERLETLTAGGSIRPEMVLQVRDMEGTTLGLRPEFTASIVRAAATRMAASSLPQRLCYHGSVFQNAQRDQEFYQSGVELIGAGDWLADAEVLLLLADCFHTLQIPTWQLILGDVGLTQGLLSILSPTAQGPVRRALTQLDRVYLETAPLAERDRQVGLQLLDLRGQPAEVLGKLAQLSLPAGQRERVAQLLQLCRVLRDQGVELVLDLSLLQPFAYYTGIVFKAVCGTEIVGSGGRYDQLYSLYSPSQDHQAGIGFTLLLEPLQRVLHAAGQLPQQLAISQRLVVPVDEKAFPATILLAQTWRQTEQMRVELELLQRSPEDLEIYARQRQIPEIVWVQADGTFHTTHPLNPSS
jgi:ATP phosphoribosyltransferase regulatory subunit